MSIFRGVKINERKMFDLHSGGKSHVKFDAMSMLADQHSREYALACLDKNVFVLRHGQHSPQIVVGIATGGAVLAAMWVEAKTRSFHASDLTLGFVEKNGTHLELTLPRKEQLPGDRYVEKDRAVFLIDDVISTGNSIDEAIELCKLNGYKVVQWTCLVDRRAL